MRNMQIRKLFASFVTSAAALGMAVGGAQIASAVNATGRDDVSVSITGEATKGRTYNAIKLADYSYVDASGSQTLVSVATVNDTNIKVAASAALQKSGKTTSEDPMSYVADHMGLDSRTPTAYAGDLRNFLMKLVQEDVIKSAISTSSISATSASVGSDQVAKFTGLEDGIYLIEDSSAPAEGALNTLPILVSTKVGGLADSQQPSGVTDTVEVKANYPGKPKKTSSKPSYNVGEVVDFKIESTVPTYTNYKANTYVLRIKDTLSKGLSYSASRMSTVITVDGTPLVEGVDYSLIAAPTADPLPGPFSFTFDLSAYMQNKIHDNDYSLAGKSIVITYNALLNDEAISVIYPDGSNVPSGKVHNNASVTFTNDPNDSSEGGKTSQTSNGSTNIYTYKMQINKVDKASDLPLEGAQFTVTDSDDKVLAFVKQADGSYRTTMPGETGSEFVESPANGQIKINGLGDGVYKIAETKAPTKDVDGNPTSKYKVIPGTNFGASIVATYGEDDALDTLHYETTADLAGLSSLIDDQNGIFKVVNIQAFYQLPMTGAYGIAFLVTVGVLLIIGGGLVYFRTRKNNQSTVAGNSVAL